MEIECLFADSDDVEVYNKEVIARAIVNGLIGANGLIVLAMLLIKVKRCIMIV